MLGTIDRAQVVELLRKLASGDAAGLLVFARTLEDWAPDYAQMLDALAALLARIALFQVVPNAPGDEIHPAELLTELAAQLSPEDTQLFYQTAILGRRDLPHAPDPCTGFEMTLLRMLAFRPAGGGNMAAGGEAAKSTPRATVRSAVQAAHPAEQTVASGEDTAAADGAADWATMLGRLELAGAARQLAAHCAWLGKEGASVRLALDARNRHLRTSAMEDKLAQALGRYFGAAVKLEIELGNGSVETPAMSDERQAALELAQARDSLSADSTVRALQDRFGAVLQTDTVRPHRNGHSN